MNRPNFRQPMYAYLILLTVCSTSGLQCWRTLFDNFAVHKVGLDGHHMGILQSVREIPGFLALLVTYVLLIIKEHRLAALSIVILGAGIFFTGLLPSFTGLILTTLAMSFGFHYYETCCQSLTLQYFDHNSSPMAFAGQQRWAALANIGVGIAIFAIAPKLSYTAMFIVFGALIMGCGIWAMTKKPETPGMPAQKKSMVVKKEYWLYYCLTFMAGARRQIFIAFAVFLLVQKFGFTVQEVTLLFLFNNGINFFINPLIGKAIIRFGERKVLSLEYLALILIFTAYAAADAKWIVALLYVLDHIFFGFSMGIKTYFHKICDPRDIAPSAAVGFTINHIAAVALPVIGGILWMVDYRIPFLAGAGLSLVSLALVQLIKIPAQN
ncbi:MAG: MFS transporter [Desulfobacter sp.]|nr:MFS transporter [Desulfobacter sp.]